MITDEQVETALRKWFKDEVTWDKGMAPWTADQFRVEMRAALEAALTLPSAGEAEPALWQCELENGTIEHYAGCFGNILESNGVRVVKKTPLYLHPSPRKETER